MRLGLALAFIPAVLFFPAVAFLTVCPPAYGRLAMVIFSTGFICSWIAAIASLVRARGVRPHDGPTLVALWLGVAISVSGLALTIYGISKSLHR
jgi:uncharacterized membrane protein